MYGDNVYHTDKSAKTVRKFIQERCAHSNKDWTVNLGHYAQDTRTDRVLLSKTFYYFGDHCISLPKQHSCIGLSKRDKRGNMVYRDLLGEDAKIQAFADWLTANYETGIHGDPCNWKEFKRDKYEVYEDEEDK